MPTPQEMTIEILSPEQTPTKVISHILHCLEDGCQMGWLVDPDDKSVIAYPIGQQPIFLQKPAKKNHLGHQRRNKPKRPYFKDALFLGKIRLRIKQKIKLLVLDRTIRKTIPPKRNATAILPENV